MKERLPALVCAIALLLCVLSLPASAAGKLEGVDYSRIRSGKSHGVVLSLGNMEFHGDLSKGSPLSQEEQDEIIRKVMNELGITSGMLLNAESIIDAASKIEGFNLNDVKKALLKLTGAETFVDLYNIVMGGGQKTSKQIASDIAKGQVVDYAENGINDVLTQGGKVALKGAGKFAYKLLFILPDLQEIGIDALTKYEKIKETTAKALERATLLDQFYDECNRRIGEESGDDGEWKIRFDGATSTHGFNFWGIGGLMSEWTLTGELVRQVTGAGEDAVGNYEGTLILEIKGVDMKNSFDKDWAKRTTEYPTIFNRDEIAGGYQGVTTTITDTTVSETVLKRTVNGEFNLYLPGMKSGEYKPALFGGFDQSDTIVYSFSHTMAYDGKIDIPGIGVVDTPPSAPGRMTSTDINSLLLEGESISWSGSDTIGMDIGTVWQPLDSKPVLVIKFTD